MQKKRKPIKTHTKLFLFSAPPPPFFKAKIKTNKRLVGHRGIQWLRHHASNAGGIGSIPGQGTKIPHATGCGKKKKIIKK